MIEKFNEVQNQRDTAVIYGSSLDQIKQFYSIDPIGAGELAISIIEVAVTGQMSTNNPLIQMALANFKDAAGKNKEKWDKQKVAQQEARIEKLQLREIAKMLKSGMKQVDIAKRLNKGKSTISENVKIIRTEFPELLEEVYEVRPNSIELSENSENNRIYNETEQIAENSEIRLSSPNLLQQSSESSANSLNSEHVNVNVNVNDNVNISPVSSDEETLESINLSEINRMGAVYKMVGNNIVEFSTGKRMKVIVDF